MNRSPTTIFGSVWGDVVGDLAPSRDIVTTLRLSVPLAASLLADHTVAADRRACL